MLTFVKDHVLEILIYVAGIITPILVTPLLNVLTGRSVERYKQDLVRAQKSERIAELFSYMPALSEGRLDPKEEQKINQLILEISLYLPYHLVCELSETFVHTHKRVKYKDLFVEIRHHLLWPRRTWLARHISKSLRGDRLNGGNVLHVSLRKSETQSLAIAPAVPPPAA